jgi:hypothetical protein
MRRHRPGESVGECVEERGFACARAAENSYQRACDSYQTSTGVRETLSSQQGKGRYLAGMSRSHHAAPCSNCWTQKASSTSLPAHQTGSPCRRLHRPTPTRAPPRRGARTRSCRFPRLLEIERRVTSKSHVQINRASYVSKANVDISMSHMYAQVQERIFLFVKSFPSACTRSRSQKISRAAESTSSSCACAPTLTQARSLLRAQKRTVPVLFYRALSVPPPRHAPF